MEIKKLSKIIDLEELKKTILQMKEWNKNTQEYN